jgi:TfoX/Sxy family transcriptional regulator of competence genes
VAQSDDANRVLTWREGIILSQQERSNLTPEQWRQHRNDSVVRDLSEIDQMPEPMRSWARKALDQAQARVEVRIAQQERREAS